MGRRDRAGQVDALRQLVEIGAPMGDQWHQLAYLAAGNCEITLAKRAVEHLTGAIADSHAGRYRKASIFFDLGLSDEAVALLRGLPHDVPDPLSNAYSRGVAALNFGNTDEARGCFEQITLAWPQLGSAWLLLTQATNVADDPPLADRLFAAERWMDAAAPAERALYYNALGKVQADRGEHAAAFASFDRSAQQMRSIVKFDRNADRTQAEEAVRGYSERDVASIASRQHLSTDRTIFVTGLPRSGTTLVEHILTSHSKVDAGAELKMLPLLAQDIGGQSFPALRDYVKEQGLEVPALLWRHWMDDRFPGRGRVVNKALDTSRFTGLAAALLPEAPLIWVTRDPLDCAWSCFRTNFRNSIPWSYEQGDIAWHFRLEDRLLEQWRDILGERLLVVPYEALVTDAEVWIRRIVAHCGLAEEPQVFAPHENKRPVMTASVMQVRRPINRDGVGAAEPYREFLQPFIDAYYD